MNLTRHVALRHISLSLTRSKRLMRAFGLMLSLCLPCGAAWAQQGLATATPEASSPVPLQPGRPGEARPTVYEPERYADVQRRIDRLSAQDKPCPVPYHLAKAQAWLNFSRDQYHERVWQGGIRDSTLDQARGIVELLEAGNLPSLDTPLVSGASRLRPDLWEAAESIKQQVPQHLCCAQKETAFCEVQLVWSGHIQKNVAGWRGTAPHIRQAEDLCGQALVQQCPAPVVTAPVPLVPPPPPAPSYERITLAAHALFHHDRSSEADLLPEGRRQLDELVVKLRQVSQVQRIIITGHADISNNTGDPNYNLKLSQARAETVALLLAGRGVKISADQVMGIGDIEPIVGCPLPTAKTDAQQRGATKRARQQWYDCLQPNRRVVIEILGAIELKP